GWLVLCPVHGDKRPSLSIRAGEDGKILVKCFSGCDGREILTTLREMGLLDGKTPSRPIPQAPTAKDRTDILDRLWNESNEVGVIAARYLAGRGITLDKWPSDLREHPSLAVYEDGKPTGQRFPALLAVIRNEIGRPAGFHITFLKEDGADKADIPTQRKMIGVSEGSTRGGCIHLMEPQDGQIGLGEGLESTLSASILTGISGWSALTAGGVERAILPPEIRKVVIFADRDRAGLKTAALACERLRGEGREAEILAPERPGLDFNDVLKNENARPVAS
ncbi:MAG: DUF7146 domain-containing protein, partial [Leptospirales bacterium]